MNVGFENTIYYRGSYLNSIDSRELYFSAGWCNYPLDEIHPSDKNWLVRKGSALVSAMVAIVKTVHHIAVAILIPIPKICGLKTESFRARVYYVLRDIQEIFGWITYLFFEIYGQAHVDESRFDKKYYDFFMIRERFFSPETDPYTLAGNLTLSQYRTEMKQKRKGILNLSKLEYLLSRFSGTSFFLDQFVAKVDSKILSLITLKDCYQTFENSKLKFAILDDEQFENLTWSELEALMPKIPSQQFNYSISYEERQKEEAISSQLLFIKQRFKLLAAKKKKKSQSLSTENFDPAAPITLKQLSGWNGTTINQHLDHIPGTAFSFFADEQLKGLKLASLNEKQVEGLFLGLKKDLVQKKLALFDDQDVANAVHSQALGGALLAYLSPAHKKKLSLLSLKAWQFDKIFPCINRGRYFYEDEMIFACYSGKDVSEAIEKGIIHTDNSLDLLTGAHWREAKISKWPFHMANAVSSDPVSHGIVKKRFHLIGQEECMAAIAASKIDKWAEHVIHSLFDPDLKKGDANGSIGCCDANSSSFSFSLEEIRKISLQKMTAGQFDRIFSREKMKKQDFDLFASFSGKDVSEAVERMLIPSNLLDLLTDEHWKEAKISKWPLPAVNGIASSNTVIAQRRFSLIGEGEIQAARVANKFNNYTKNLISLMMGQSFDEPYYANHSYEYFPKGFYSYKPSFDSLSLLHIPDNCEAPLALAPLSLKNRLNSCYLDSVLEILLSQDEIRKKIFDAWRSKEIKSVKETPSSKEIALFKSKHQIFEELCRLLISSNHEKGLFSERVREAIFESELNVDFNFNSIYKQHDAAAVLLLINDILDNSFESIDIDTSITEGKKGNLTCKRPSFISHILPLSCSEKVYDKMNLTTLLDCYCSPQKAISSKGDEETREFVTADGKKVNQPFMTETKIETFPDLLPLQIKRFDNHHNKLEQLVLLPADGIIDMTPYSHKQSEEPIKYEIIGYVTHDGKTLNIGHYTANIKIGERFYHCDDQMSSYSKEISQEEFYQCNDAYLIMLKRLKS